MPNISWAGYISLLIVTVLRLAACKVESFAYFLKLPLKIRLTEGVIGC
jgi:hypothetical protein